MDIVGFFGAQLLLDQQREQRLAKHEDTLILYCTRCVLEGIEHFCGP
jgi:hypothetical protein